jgi:PelA/Pel-15E family pectate lyase
MEFLRDAQQFEFLDAGRREAAQKSFNRGIECILKCQVIVNGTPTVWCAQHDEVTLEPQPARAFELVSLSGAESVGIVRLLMSLDKPAPEVVRAVNAAFAWFESAKLTGIRVDVINGDKVVVPDANARPLWARFYEIGTNRPVFCGRDGVKQYSLSEIDAERRNGYAWCGNWPERLIQEEYPRWKKALGQAEPAANGAKLRVVLVGDSTVAHGSGWGDAFGKMLSPDASCENGRCAVGGEVTTDISDWHG